MGSTSGAPVISCRGVTKRFGPVVALDRLDLEVPGGTVTGYLGPNGAGKSTTIRLLLDLARPDSGEVRVLGDDPRRAGPALRRRIGFIPGELGLDERLRVDETLTLWARLRGGVDPRRVDELCARLALDPTRSAKGLSSGNRRKVGLVGALMGDPELLILDEPTNGLDPLVQAEFHAIVGEVVAAGRSVFLSSHVLSEVQHLADHVVVLREGRVVRAGTVEELRREARQPFTAWFPGPPPADELRSLPGVAELTVRDHEVEGVIEGRPGALLAVLARHDVIHVLLPEPDLDDAFLRLYSEAPR